MSHDELGSETGLQCDPSDFSLELNAIYTIYFLCILTQVKLFIVLVQIKEERCITEACPICVYFMQLQRLMGNVVLSCMTPH